MRVSRTRPRWAWLAAWALTATTTAGQAPEPAVSGPTPWRTTEDGLAVRVHAGQAGQAGWPAFAVLVRVDPTRHALRVLTAPSAEGFRVSDAAREAGALAAINGGFFDGAGRAIGWVVSDGQTRVPLARAGWGVFVIPRAGAPAIHAAGAVPEGLDAREALEAGPRLVIGGRPNSLKRQVARRSFIGLDGQGRVVLGSTGLVPAEAGALARFLAAPEEAGGCGLQSALALDGGSSAQLFVRHGADDGSDLQVPGGTAVPNALAVMPMPAPERD